MNSLKKDEGVPLLNFEGVPALTFEGGPTVPGPGVLVTLLHHAVKFKQTNQTCSPWKLNQSINVEWRPDFLMERETCQLEKYRRWWNYIF